MLIHGDDDRNVALQQTIDLVEKLRAQLEQAFTTYLLPGRPFGLDHGYRYY
jgi:dipeptidyl aminopeptidase/acylaminoacyl peptidase